MADAAAVPSEEAARTLAGALVRAGVRHVCITPGSRSTPLTVAFARTEGVRCWLHIDERSSSFFALGIAKVTGEPVALVCTSGTAAANYLPAVVEANLTRIPLVVLTADRPPRLRDVGADQTIDQVRMFGTNVRWAQDLAAPVGADFEPAFYESSGVRAVRQSLAPLPGPVHLNVSFEEPLIGAPGTPAPVRPGTHAIVRADSPPPSEADITAAVRELDAARRPIIVAGPETGGLPAPEIAALAARLGAPVFADPLSGLRTGGHDLSHILAAYDALVRDPRAKSLAPDAVIRFGAPPTSKALNQFLTGLAGIPHVLCDGWGSWRDPFGLATSVISGGQAAAARMLTAALSSPRTDAHWAGEWLTRDRCAGESLRYSVREFDLPFEGRVFTELQDALPAGATVFAGNSMPVRDMDSFVGTSPKRLEFVGNRGANGIDGVVSSALGVAAVSPMPTLLVIGDLSFYHDLNGLWAAARHGLDLTVVLVNNNGGGIFHYLPQAAHPDIFEEWFGTPGNLDFTPVVGMYGGEHHVVESWDDFRALIQTPACGLRVLELRTDRTANTEMHRAAWARAAEAAWGGS